MYNVQFYDLSHFENLKSIWEELFKGEDMTYFQSFDWYNMLVNLNISITNKNFVIIFGVVSDSSGKAVLIAPLWIVTKTFKRYNKKGAYFFGRKQWPDYLNYIYKGVNYEILHALFKALKDRYNIDKVYFEETPSESQLLKVVTTHYEYVEECITKCVHLHIPDNIDAYKTILTKGFRQNLRTAINRTQKDGIEFIFNYDDKNVDINAFLKDRINRIRVKEAKWIPSNYTRLKLFVRSILTGDYWCGEYRFPDYNPITHDPNSKTMTCCTTDGQLCAAFNYGFDAERKRIVLMAVSTNSKYSRYSPGIQLVYNYIIDQMTKKEIKCIDFSRGTEKYKYDLGGKEHFNKSITITI